MLSKGLILRDRYRIVGKIGKGGTSSVYLATDISIGKKWAVKYLPGKDDETVWLAQNEINMMVRLDHEMFPRIVDAWQEEEGYYIVSDYIEGVTLDKVLSKKQINKRIMTDWWLDIAQALNYLHSCKPSILYLDLKLENIMLKNDGSLKLIDFGIAGRIAERGSLYGTPGYAAPEQYYNRGDMLDERTDVFAFGMLMYAMYTNRRPLLKLEDQREIVQKNRRIPGKIRDIILNCIGEKKEERYRGMDEVIFALKLLKGKDRSALKLKAVTAMAVVCIGVFGASAVRYVVAEPREDIVKTMLSELNGHIEDGEYTDEGIRIICGYIESGCLDEETVNRFTYEVAKNYFSKKRNYREALRYFSRLDTEEYPDACFYMELCSLQVSFEEDDERYVKCLRDFGEYNRGLGYEEGRYKNDFMLANLYDARLSEDTDEIDEEIALLERGLHDLRYAIEAGMFTDTDAHYESEYVRRLCLLYEEKGDVNKTVKYGEQALELIDPTNRQIRDDIKDRLDKIRVEKEREY